ncbi:MAG: S-layer homology domain-containing protein [Clostridia bacterium]|nr:S-layer homology domain-containing protein [Clostridia bacterium]
MNKRILSFFVFLAMLTSCLPCGFAQEQAPSAVTVSFTAQKDGAFIFAPQMSTEVSSDFAESYGYTDSVSGVSALDVLVKAHKIAYGDSFTAQSAAGYLTVPESGFITKLFGEETSANGFLINGAFPHDGTLTSWGYNGTTVTNHQILDGDLAEFFTYEDTTNWSDEIAWLDEDDEITAAPGASVELTLKSVTQMYSSSYENREALRAVGSAVGSAQLAWVNMENGSLDLITGAVTDTDGSVTVSAPEETGTFYLTAYMPENAVGEPLIMSLTKLTVSNDTPVYGDCDLVALSVTDFDNNPVAIELSPAFDSDTTAYSVPAVVYESLGFLYVKATAANSSAMITAECNDVTQTVTSGDSGWKLLMYALTPGINNILTLTVSAEDDTKEYTVTIPMKPETNTAPSPVSSGAAAKISIGDTYRLSLDTLFTDADEIDTLTYKVSVNGEAAQASDAAYSFTPDAPGTYTLAFTANDSTADSEPYTVTLTVEPYTEITVPSDCTLFVGENLRGSWSYNYFLPFKEYTPADREDNGDGTTTYFYNLTGNLDSNIFNYRITGDNYITYAGKFVKTDGFSMTVTAEDLAAEGKTKATTDKNPLSNNGYNEGNIYLNINKNGHLLMDTDETYQLVPLRRWEITDTTENNYIIEPDYKFSVISLTDEDADSIITVDKNGLITAKGAGSAIVLVTYDAINVNGFAGGPFFGAINPENTGVFVVTVDGESLDVVSDVDSELDVVYFTGEEGSYTIETDEPVWVINPVTDSSLEEVAPNVDGTVTVPLSEGRNVIKTGSGYRVVTAKKLSYTVNNGEEVHPGDEISIVFDTVYHPAPKLAGVYNASASILYTTPGGATAGSKPDTYTFASSPDSQTVKNLITRSEGEEWGYTTYSYTLGEALTVPADWNTDVYTLTGGKIVAYGYGDPFGNHRSITYTSGKAPNDNYNMKEGFFGVLPDIEIPVSATSSPISSIAVDATSARTSYYAGDTFDRENLVVTATYEDTTTQLATNYTVTPEILTEDTTEITVTYRGKTATVPVTVTPLEVLSIALTTPPSKTSYTAGETFDPTGMVITATYNSGKTEPTTDYTYSPASVLTADNTEMTVTYTGKEGISPVTVPITVSSGGGGGSTSTVNVYFTLLGDSKHGEGGAVHTLKNNNLSTWISKRQITVDRGSYVIDVLTKALSLSGIPYSCPTGTYIESIKGLGEFDNGSTSGWMYTVNGTHPTQGIDKKTVKNGDTIVFHYTDDYTVERSSDRWTGTSGGSSSKAPEKEKEDTKAEETPVFNETTFRDVKPEHWHYRAVKFVYENGLMQGTDKGFEPDIPMTRAMLVTILYRLEDKPLAENGAPSFEDVEISDYYADAVAWAAEKGIVTGTGGSLFSPDANVTREQTAVILHRYAQYKNINIEENKEKDLFSFEDSENLSPYAVTAFEWAVKTGIIQGETQTHLMPGSSSTRAQVATILMRFTERN